MTTTTDENNTQPAVTILLASYNRLEFLKDAVSSALNQRYPDYKVLIVDDGSDGEVIEWLQALESSEPLVSVYYQSHQGVSAARAAGVEQADTDLICILDSDDRLVEDALELLVAAMLRQPDVHLVYGDIREFRSSGETEIRHYVQYESAPAMTMATLLKPRVPFKHSGTLFRRQTALDMGSYDLNLPCKVDIDLYLRFLRAGHLPQHVDKPVVDFRMHKDSVSIDRLTGIKVWLYMIDEYGPSNPLQRLFIKIIRVSAELLKRVYIEIKG